MNKPTAKPRIFLQALKVAVLSVGLALVMVNPVLAAEYGGGYDTSGLGYDPTNAAAGASNAIKVDAESARQAIVKAQKAIDDSKKKITWEQIRVWFRDKSWQALKDASAAAYRAALKNFLNTFAYDMATYLATGDKGQLPMFETQGWGGYLSNVADNAAGTFIEQFGKTGFGIKFNLCNPDFNVMLKINMGLVQSKRPKAPACTFSKMTSNWDAALKDKNFLPKFQDMFNPWSNDLGIALTLQTGMESEINKALNSAIKDREEGAGFKAVKDKISGYVKTPARSVLSAMDITFQNANKDLFVYTGSVVADSVDIFINTLMGKLIEKWLKGGLVTSFPKLTNKLDSLTNINAQNSAEGLAGAQDRMKSIVEPNFKVRADYDILAELATCPDPNKAGPTNCVIDEKFRQAIEKKMTVGEALKQGYLSNSLFGFLAAGRKDNTTPEPMFNEGYPYRSMIILRKYRIIPVGWEIAAQKINDGADNVSEVRTLGDLVNCFSSTDDYNGYHDTWCEDLVDPSWVLKAPQNFCAREGAGPEILSQQVTGEGADSSLAVLRNDTYCADEQSVITEKNDGSPVYGYCTEERRKWDFNANSCEPLSNTCQTFGSSGGQTNSYLENTLDFGPPCGPGNVGCQKYAIASSSVKADMDDIYNSDEKAVVWQKSNQEVHLNKQAEACDASSEGCHQFIRLNPGGGANLLTNAGFEESLDIGGWGGFGAVNVVAPYQGSRSLKLNVAPNSREVIVGTPGYNLAGESYALSFYAKGCAAIGNKFWIEDESKSANFKDDANWTRNNLTYTYPADANTNEVTFKLTISSSSCLIDNIKLERGTQATNFSNYATGPSLIHEKLLPDYLMSSCYADAGDYYAPKSSAPAICSDFARKCKRDEAGCELYTSASNETKIPAKVKAEDYCPAACVGYNTFIQSATTFDSPREAYFIPRLAKACSAEANSCDEFTNLEQATTTTPNVAEQKEYYTALRQCVKPNTPNEPCGDFYTWEGSDESGFQLKVESLASNIINSINQPVLTETYVKANCDDAVYNLPVSDPHHSNDCRQFYNTDGVVLYRLYSNTKTCTADCHPYRRTEVNIDSAITSQSACGGTDCSELSSNLEDKCWNKNSNPDLSQCVSCKGGGSWSFSNQACIYMAVPSQGTTCAAAQNGCREYTGNTGNNIRKIFTDDFSNGTTDGWIGLGSSKVSPSNESLTLGADNKGHSIFATSTPNEIVQIKRQVGADVSKGLDYILNFVVRADQPTDLSFSLVNANGEKAYFAPVHLKAGWQILPTNLTGLNHDATSSEIIMATTTSNFYIGNIALTEIVDRYYLIKSSLRTNLPASCDEKSPGVPEDLFMLGCDQYTDRASKTHYLKNFSSLCSESAVGCELMIDTHNSSVADATYYNIDGGKVDKASDANLTVPADNPVYVVYDQNKQCSAQEKGCERLGQAYKYESTTLYGDVYLKNDPDKYGQILCGSNAVGCDIFGFNNGTTDNGEKYFKDPGDQVCDWRQQQTGTGANYGWYKKKVKRCDDGFDSGEVNGKIDASGNPLAPDENHLCLSDLGCSIVAEKDSIKCANDAACGDYNKCVKPSGEQTGTCRYSCVTDNNDYKCPTDEGATKTLGLGGIGNRVVQPTGDGWVGICPAADSGCTEYIDPMSKFNTNLIFNGSFADLDGKSSTVDGWAVAGNSYIQSVTSLEPNTVYRLATEKNNSGSPVDLKISCPNSTLYAIGEDNKLSNNPSASITVTATHDRDSTIFYYKVNASVASASCTVTAGDSKGAVELKKAVIDYQLAQNLDSKSCNGLVNTGQGCVLFNERKQDGANLAALNWDADTGNISGSVADGDKDSNIILKVAPDRVCSKWLACKSYIKDSKGDNVCFDVGLCDAVDASGNCQSFISSPKTNQVADTLTAAGISNLSGYSKVGISGGSLINDYYPFGAMEQKGEVANISNGGFEYSGSNGYPIGWSWGSANQDLRDKPWNVGIFSIVNNPIAVQSEGIGYAPEGSSFLKLGSSYEAVSEQIDVMPLTDYIITAYVNTKNLKNGLAKIDIMDKNYIAGYPNSGTAIPSTISPQDVGMDWSFKMGKFKTDAGVSQIKVKLYSSGTPEGNFYFDDIKVRPALESRCKENCAVANYTGWYTAQSCRLYPQTDSLSCDYYEDSGKRQKGWPGYCLEYDRRPGDPNTCLLWYPIDKVKGDGVEEGAGYLGKTPVYYCVGGQSEKVYEYRHAFYYGRGTWDGCENITKVACGLNYDCAEWGVDKKDGWDDVSIACIPNGKKLIASDGSVDVKTNINPTSSNDGWYPYDNDNLMAFSSVTNTSGVTTVADVKAVVFTDDKYAKFICDSAFDQGAATTDKCCSSSDKTQCDKPTDVLNCACILTKELYRSKAFCTNVVQTVSPAGQNKYWSSRVYEGSDYTVDPSGLNYKYETDATPFGSMVPPSSNPYDWDGQPTKDNNQPIYYSTDKTIIRSGKGYGCTDCDFIVDDLAQDNFPYAYEKLPNPTSLTGVELVKRLFAQSYGVWDWNGSHYVPPLTDQSWGPPGSNSEKNYGKCSYTTRPVDSTDYCAILPEVTNIKVNGLPVIPGGADDIVLTNSQFIKLSFNSRADSQQLPLVMYGVDWGDNSKTVVTGVEMRDKPNTEQPEIIYHLYSYWDLRAKNATDKSLEGGNTVYCGGANLGATNYNNIPSGFTCPADSACCAITPKIQIRDNWGWCNKGTKINTCDQWNSFGENTGTTADDWVVVKEKSGSIVPPPPASCSCVDNDHDGHYPLACSDTNCTPRDDCNDNSAAVHPGATEVCGDGIDQDCSGADCSVAVLPPAGGGLTASPSSVSVAVGVDANVLITGGIPPYSMSMDPETQHMSSSFSGNTLNVTGSSPGANNRYITDSAGTILIIPITVTASAGGLTVSVLSETAGQSPFTTSDKITISIKGDSTINATRVDVDLFKDDIYQPTLYPIEDTSNNTWSTKLKSWPVGNYRFNVFVWNGSVSLDTKIGAGTFTVVP